MSIEGILGKQLTVRLLGDAAAVAAEAAARIERAASESIAERGAFHLVLAGGGTPQQAYRLLANIEAEWSRWHIYFGDERCLPADDAERNSVMAERAWLAQSPIPKEQIHPIPAERGAEAAAAAYSQTLSGVLPFDMVLLGMGEDGHTASLFPGHPLEQEGLATAVHDAPKPPPDRVSLTPRALNATRRLLFLVTGAGKHKALEQWRRGEQLPVSAIAAAGSAELLLDRAAAAEWVAGNS